MFENGPNPAKLQVLPPHKRFTAPAPLVLFHDGGGTTFSYFILGNLNREVYAIHNPNYFSGQPFKGGMNAMARHYIDLMTKAGISGQVILGGMLILLINFRLNIFTNHLTQAGPSEVTSHLPLPAC